MNRARAAAPPRRGADLDPPHRPNHLVLSPGTLALLLGTLAMVALAVVRMWSEARRGMFSSDECFHAYVSEWMLAHHRVPGVLPEFYSGFYYYYQPLLHLLGALWGALFGLAALHVLPVVFGAACPLVLLVAAPRRVPLAARCWAALLCVLNASLASYAVRFYVESLTTLLFIAAIVAFIEFDREPRARSAIALGGLIGLALLAKFSGAWLLGLIAIEALVAMLRRDRPRARWLALAAGIAIALDAPWLMRNQVLFGSALYPLFAPDLDRPLYALNRHTFSMAPAEFLRGIPAVLGPWISVVSLAAIVRALATRRFAFRERVLVFSLLAMLAMAWMPMAADRHLNVFLPGLTLVSAWSLAETLEKRRRLNHAIGALLIVAAIVSWTGARDDRFEADPSDELREALAAVAPRVPADDTILSLWTYDTFYYTRRNATWPIPWGQRVHPAVLFTETDPARFLAQLDLCGIDALLVPREADAPNFDSANYPASFLQCVQTLVARGELRLEWQSATLALLVRTRRGG
jgi:hypothetical protein